MKRIGILGRLGAVLLSTMAHGGWPAEIAQGQRGSGKSRAAATVANHRFKNMGRPAARRWWHDPEQPDQAATILFAAGKRDRKAEKLHSQTINAWLNPAHVKSENPEPGQYTRWFTPTLNPFHVAH